MFWEKRTEGVGMGGMSSVGQVKRREVEHSGQAEGMVGGKALSSRSGRLGQGGETEDGQS